MSDQRIPIGARVDTYDGAGEITAHVVAFDEPAYLVRLDTGRVATFDTSRLRRAATCERCGETIDAHDYNGACLAADDAS